MNEDEVDRLAALTKLNILDTPPERQFDDLVRLASAICGTPISLVSLVDENRQWFKASVGLTASETPRNVSFCAHAIHQPDIFVVEDATRDPRFLANPLVTDDPKLRFYAGVPLQAPGGARIGTLCVIDTIPRNITKSQRDALIILGAQVQAQMALRLQQQALEDSLREKAHLANQLEASQHMFRTFMENSPNHAWVKDSDGRLVFYNREVEKFFGIGRSEWLGRTTSEILPAEEAEHYLAQDRQTLTTGENIECLDHMTDAEGNRHTFRAVKFAYKDLNGRTMLAKIAQDITEQLAQAEALTRANEQLEKLATTDFLTSLPTRRVFASRAAVEFADWERHHSSLTILTMDIDNFKDINDRFGHAAGDTALSLIGKILAHCCRIGDIPRAWEERSSPSCCPALAPKRRFASPAASNNNFATSSPACFV